MKTLTINFRRPVRRCARHLLRLPVAGHECRSLRRRVLRLLCRFIRRHTVISFVLTSVFPTVVLSVDPSFV